MLPLPFTFAVAVACIIVYKTLNDYWKCICLAEDRNVWWLILDFTCFANVLSYYLLTFLHCPVLRPCWAASSTPSTMVAARRIWRKRSSQSAPADYVPGYTHFPLHQWTILYHGCAVCGRFHMRVPPPGTLCLTTFAPWLILSSFENCWNYTFLVKLLTFVDFCVFLGLLIFGWLL